MITIFQVRLTKCKHYEFALNLIERNIQPIMFQCFVKNNKNYQKSYPYDNIAIHHFNNIDFSYNGILILHTKRCYKK